MTSTTALPASTLGSTSTEANLYPLGLLARDYGSDHHGSTRSFPTSCISGPCFPGFLAGSPPTICRIKSSFSPPIVGLGRVIKILDAASLVVLRDVSTGGRGTPASAWPKVDGMRENRRHLLVFVAAGFGSVIESRVSEGLEEVDSFEKRADVGDSSVVLLYC